MKKQNENGRISEDRLSRANKRKKNNTIASILVMTGCLLVLVLVTYVAGILYSWIDRKFQDNANDLAAAAEAGGQTESAAEAAKTYTQEEVDALIAEAKQQAEDEEHVHAAPEEAVLLFADDHVGGGADAQEGLAADVEHVGDGQGGDEIGAPRVRPPVQQQVGEGPVIGLRAHGRCVLRWLHDVPQGLDDRPEHDRPGHPGTEDHGYP